MNALANIDSDALAGSQPTVSQEEAEKAAQEAGIDLNVVTIGNRDKVGRYIAPAVAGKLVAEIQDERDDTTKIRRVLMAIIDDKNTTRELKIQAAETIAKLQKANTESAAVQLKAAEIAAIGAKAAARKAAAPQLRAAQANVFNGPTQVNLSAEQPKE